MPAARKVVTRSPKRNVGLINCPWFQDRPIEHESRLEKHFVLRAMLFPGLKSIQHQPFHLPLVEHGKRYTPDFLLTFSNGERLVFEVKRAERIKKQKGRFDEITALFDQASLRYFVVHQGQIEGQRRAERAALIRRYAMHALNHELTRAVMDYVFQRHEGTAIERLLKKLPVSQEQLLGMVAQRHIALNKELLISDGGFPSRKGTAKLKAAVFAAAGSADQTESHRTQVDRSEDTAEFEQEMSIKFSSDDFILGGEQHKVIFERILNSAKKRVVIHSTFIDQAKFRQHMPLIERAARRGVRIDVLWGKSDGADGTNSTADAVAACRSMLISDIVRERVHIHGISTDSHAKLIIADNGTDGLVAVVGSCNWLSSGFESFEISAYLRAPAIVAEIAGKLSSMTMGASGLWSPLTRDLAALSTTASSASQPRAGIIVKSSLVMGAQHNAYMTRARDEAETSITIASHRMSPSAETLVLIPASEAMRTKDIAVKLYYGKVTGVDGGTAAVNMGREAQLNGMKVSQILEPRLHAKFLAWDSDSVVITSQNWMSADPPDDKPYSEIGIFLKGPSLARDLVARVRAALEQLPA